MIILKENNADIKFILVENRTVEEEALRNTPNEMKTSVKIRHSINSFFLYFYPLFALQQEHMLLL